MIDAKVADPGGIFSAENWPDFDWNGGRLQIGMVAGLWSDWRPASRRNPHDGRFLSNGRLGPDAEIISASRLHTGRPHRLLLFLEAVSAIRALTTGTRQKRSRTLQKRQDQAGHFFGVFPMDVMAATGKRNELRADDRIFHLGLMHLSCDHVLLAPQDERRRINILQKPRGIICKLLVVKWSARCVTAPPRFRVAHGRGNSHRPELHQNTIRA